MRRRRKKRGGGREGGRGGEDNPRQPPPRASPLRLFAHTKRCLHLAPCGRTHVRRRARERGWEEGGNRRQAAQTVLSPPLQPGEYGRMRQKTCRSASKSAPRTHVNLNRICLLSKPFPKAGSGAQKVVKGGRRRRRRLLQCFCVLGLWCLAA